MLIAIVGTRASGKDSVHRYLVDKGFTPLALAEAEPDNVRIDPFPRSAHLTDLHSPSLFQLSHLNHKRGDSYSSTSSASDDHGFFSLAPSEGPDTDRADDDKLPFFR